MSTRLKLIERFKQKPRDFTWRELISLLQGYGYQADNSGKTSGSRVKFLHNLHPVIFMHRPHPEQILKKYQIEYIYNFLEGENLL